jgi:PadR family transcriptional regulator, regulatory protein PadR
MNASTDERFYALAIKVAANRATADEKAELDEILSREPRRCAEFKRVQENSKLAAASAPIIYEASAKVAPLPEKYRALMHRRVAEVFGPPQSAPQAATPKELSAKEMEALLLKVIAERPMDGFELTCCLEKAALKLKGSGEGAIYGLLSKLETAGCLEGRWRERGSRMIKTYHLTDKGTGLLQKKKGLAGQLNEWSQAVLAFDPSQT